MSDLISCKTEGCSMGDEKHTPHVDGVPVCCCFCAQVMTEVSADD
jgi:hypothetical protein